ncbi:LysR family transcriptional regulator [Archangium lipolyticum]|uniref:LysR family transcriptional regulator n=1 Tax=Archangium lipolyticum TaxID=2970465 RepID=UPI002149A2F2|nr:LysR family transcriptional regulator [Archangium lipolyticum]
MDRLGSIEAFVKAAELGSFTLAARRLRLSPSALSRRVAWLEEELGVRLLHRTTRAVRLSEDGRVFFERCRDSLRELEEAQHAVSSLRERPAGLLRVEVPTVLGRHVLVPALTRFVSRHAEVRVELHLRDHPLDPTSEGIDVALRLGALEDSGLIARKLGRTRMRICGAPGYLKRKGTPRTVEALSRHDCLGLSLHGRVMPWRLRDRSRVRELPPHGRIVVNNSEALIDLAVSGAGLAWVCDFMMARAHAAGQLVEVLEDAACEQRPIHALSLPSRQALPKVRAFVEFLAEELARNGVET